MPLRSVPEPGPAAVGADAELARLGIRRDASIYAIDGDRFRGLLRVRATTPCELLGEEVPP
jgi:hypothetical protein